MNKIEENQELPVLVLPDMVLLHETNMNLKITKKIGREIHNRVKDHDYFGIAVATKGGLPARFYAESDLYRIGTLIKIENAAEMKDFYHLKVEIIERVEIKEFIKEGLNYCAKYSLLPDIDDLDRANQEEILKHVGYLVSEISENFKESKAYTDQIKQMTDVGKVIANIFPYMRLSLEEKQEFLEIRSLKENRLKILEILIEQKESIQFQMEMAAKLNEEMNKKHRENLLKEQLRVIQDELSETTGNPGKKDYRELIDESDMPDDVREIALEEVNKLERQGPHSSEENVIRNYLDLLVALPWGESEIKDIDIEAARKILNEEHYGLDKVKDRIIQHLTVMKLKQNKQGSILLLVGPPGTGKTSLGKSIAEALEREYVRISLGGVKDESEIRGHRRTYVGALPGRIIQGMKRAGDRNPVFILDEVDKLMASYSGDPASALLEVLDPEQNNTFLITTSSTLRSV
jgi:ATP-dependent Lon protease